MQVTAKRQPQKRFEPIKLEITFETELELYAFSVMCQYNVTVPSTLPLSVLHTDKLKSMLSLINKELRYANYFPSDTTSR